MLTPCSDKGRRIGLMLKIFVWKKVVHSNNFSLQCCFCNIRRVQTHWIVNPRRPWPCSDPERQPVEGSCRRYGRDGAGRLLWRKWHFCRGGCGGFRETPFQMPKHLKRGLPLVTNVVLDFWKFWTTYLDGSLWIIILLFQEKTCLIVVNCTCCWQLRDEYLLFIKILCKLV